MGDYVGLIGLIVLVGVVLFRVLVWVGGKLADRDRWRPRRAEEWEYWRANEEYLGVHDDDDDDDEDSGS